MVTEVASKLQPSALEALGAVAGTGRGAMTIHDLAVTTTKLLGGPGLGPGVGPAPDSTEALHHHITMQSLHHPAMLPRSRFMITDILSNNNNNNNSSENNNGLLRRSPCSSPASVSSDGPRDLSLHARDADPHGDVDADLSDDHEESGTDSGLPGETSSVCSNGEFPSFPQFRVRFRSRLPARMWGGSGMRSARSGLAGIRHPSRSRWRGCPFAPAAFQGHFDTSRALAVPVTVPGVRAQVAHLCEHTFRGLKPPRAAAAVACCTDVRLDKAQTAARLFDVKGLCLIAIGFLLTQ